MKYAKADGPRVTARRIAATWLLDREASPDYPRFADRAGVPQCAHAAHMERPDLFNRLAADFLARG